MDEVVMLMTIRSLGFGSCLQRSSSPDCPWRQEGGQGPAGAAGSGFSTCSILPGIDSPPLINKSFCDLIDFIYTLIYKVSHWEMPVNETVL